METLPTCKIWNIRIFETVVGRENHPQKFDSSPFCKNALFPQFAMCAFAMAADAMMMIILNLDEWMELCKTANFWGEKSVVFTFFGVLWKGIVAYDWELGVAISKIIIWLLISNLSISNLLLILMLFSFPKERRLTKKFQAISYWNVSLLTTPIFDKKSNNRYWSI